MVVTTGKFGVIGRHLANRYSNRLRYRDQTPVRLPAGRHFLNVLCYVRSWLVDLESCEALHHRRLKNVSDGQRAVASPSVPLNCNIPHEFYTGTAVSMNFEWHSSKKEEKSNPPIICDMKVAARRAGTRRALAPALFNGSGSRNNCASAEMKMRGLIHSEGSIP